ncbi:hypothetical protein NPIL_13881 [Nephila pilipes]|uniref:Uncharacterized protein n=1 Tax=Nephila pilipes TaxID=299642 RepID=A0A8X6M7Y9_NEPPI|nr:hypothetical protein NPIL_13881 [Nephila pilipes]
MKVLLLCSFTNFIFVSLFVLRRKIKNGRNTSFTSLYAILYGQGIKRIKENTISTYGDVLKPTSVIEGLYFKMEIGTSKIARKGRPQKLIDGDILVSRVPRSLIKQLRNVIEDWLSMVHSSVSSSVRNVQARNLGSYELTETALD